MDALIYFAVWAALLFVVLRKGCGAHVMGRGDQPTSPGNGPDGALRWVAPERDIDPVCRKTVRTANAKPSVHDGTVFYFCSRECREIFEAAPTAYVRTGTPAHIDQLERDHV